MSGEGKGTEREAKPAQKEIPTLGLPVVILGSLWGAVSIVLSAYKLINDKRDEIVHLLECQGLIAGKLRGRPEQLAKCFDCCDPDVRIFGPLDLYFGNLLPLSLGVCLFLAIVTYGLWKMPSYVNLTEPETRRKVQRITAFTASLPAFALAGFGIGTLFDAYTVFAAYLRLH